MPWPTGYYSPPSRELREGFLANLKLSRSDVEAYKLAKLAGLSQGGLQKIAAAGGGSPADAMKGLVLTALYLQKEANKRLPTEQALIQTMQKLAADAVGEAKGLWQGIRESLPYAGGGAALFGIPTTAYALHQNLNKTPEGKTLAEDKAERSLAEFADSNPHPEGLKNLSHYLKLKKLRAAQLGAEHPYISALTQGASSAALGATLGEGVHSLHTGITKAMEAEKQKWLTENPGKEFPGFGWNS